MAHRSAHGVCAVHWLGNPQRQAHAYAHSIVVYPTNRFVLTATWEWTRSMSTGST